MAGMHASGWSAALWGLVAGSSFVIGGVAALRLRPSDRTVGLLTALGAGALFAAVAYKLIDEAGRLAGGLGRVGLGLIIGSLLSLFASGGWRPTDDEVAISFRSLAVTVVPEAIVIVGGLLGGHVSAAMIGSVFLCGVPEAIRATGKLVHDGRTPRAVLGVWGLLAVLCSLSAGVAYVLLESAPDTAVAFVLAAAGGAVLTELTTELVPDARHLAGRVAGPTVVIGFGLVFGLIEVI